LDDLDRGFGVVGDKYAGCQVEQLE